MKLEEYYPDKKEEILSAERFARQKHSGQKRKSGEPFISHPLAVAKILAAEGLGSETIIAAILHDTLEDTDASAKEIKEGWGETVCQLVEGITKVERATDKERKAETYRKLLLAASFDARVLVIKIADRLHNLRTIDALPKTSRKRVAEETLAVYTPIAHRLGLGRMQHELEDRCLRVLRPEDYKRAEAIQKERRSAGQKEIRRLQGQLRRSLNAADINDFQIKSRVKSIFSIAEKMRRREATEIWDVLGLRIIVTSRADCYRALGVVHEIWKPLPEHFDDYIAVPRGGLYRSLHTTVMTPRGRPLEVQIRSKDMDELAERGLAAHWLYKEDLREGGPTKRFIQQAARAESLKGNSLEEVFRDLRNDTFSKEIYLFTPDGDIRFLPEGSTPIDFAYAIHSEVGARCAGARVNGKLAPLSKPLPSGSQVEIIIDPEGEPRADWLQSVKSTKARSRIRAWMADQAEEGRSAEGLERIKESLINQNMRPLADNLFESLERAGYTDPEETGKRALRNRALLRDIVRDIIQSSGQKTERQVVSRAEEEDEIEVSGMQGVLIRKAGCCNPLPGNSIIGYVSLGRGVSVHKEGCASVTEWKRVSPERLIEVRWRDSSVVISPKLSLWAKESGPEDVIIALQSLGDEIEEIKIKREGGRLEVTSQVRLARRENEEVLRAALNSLEGLIQLEM